MGALTQGGLWFGGTAKTPWKTDRISSGSSAGSAAATAAGLVGFAIGTETLGSIVWPSIRCGVVGLRPPSALPTAAREGRFCVAALPPIFCVG
ncbi:MAG: amidase family protein [Bryobacterales bacterium]|nr:amidase family protein [Bryobacterales bacterium]